MLLLVDVATGKLANMRNLNFGTHIQKNVYL